MGDLGDIFDMFSRDDDNNKKQSNAQDPGSQSKNGPPDTKTQIMNKLKQNKMLLFILVGVVLLSVGAVAYFIVGYTTEHGIKGILDIVMPFIK